MAAARRQLAFLAISRHRPLTADAGMDALRQTDALTTRVRRGRCVWSRLRDRIRRPSHKFCRAVAQSFGVSDVAARGDSGGRHRHHESCP